MTALGHAVLLDWIRVKSHCFSEDFDAVAKIPIEKETL